MKLLNHSVILAAMIGAVGAPAHAADSKDELNTVQRAVHVCAACHGEAGRSTQASIPSLAGQMRDYTIRQLTDFRSQARSETDVQAYMWGISALLTDDAIVGLADYYAQQTPAEPRSTDLTLENTGRALYNQGLPDQAVLACGSCHGNKAEGQAGFPRLAGLNSDYVMRQLQAFGTPLRPHGVVMKNEIRSLTDTQRRALAAYVQSL